MAALNSSQVLAVLCVLCVTACTTIEASDTVPSSASLGDQGTPGFERTAPQPALSDADTSSDSEGSAEVAAGDAQAPPAADVTIDVDSAAPERATDAQQDASATEVTQGPVEDDTSASGDDASTCTPQCEGVQCGPDGCGGSCGDCVPGQLCSQGVCIDPGSCNPNCTDKICGPDTCGGICGYCTYPEVCDAEGQCVEVCVPSCEGKFCGPDGCGGDCGTCEDPLLCGDDGICYQPGCVPSCIGKVCGNDGCGGDCGICAEPKICQNGSCQLGPCGTVTSVGECQGNVVVWCSEGVFLLEDDCDSYVDHACTYDGFANSYACKPVGPCTPKCEDKLCGSDACGGWCGLCPAGWSCLAGACAPEQGADCGGEITTLGECISGALWFCSLDKLYSVDCESIGQSCAWDQSQGKYGCL